MNYIVSEPSIKSSSIAPQWSAWASDIITKNCWKWISTTLGEEDSFKGKRYETSKTDNTVHKLSWKRKSNNLIS